MKKKIVMVAIIVTMVVGLHFLSLNPIITSKTNISESYIEAIENQSKGVYSKIIPLVPIYVSVDTVSDDKVFYTIHYFPFGTVGMSYIEGDGYNIEKPLTHQ